MSQRILTIAHGHPERIAGGGEIIAYGCHKEYARSPDVENAWFLARGDLGPGTSGRVRQIRRNEYIWDQATGDPFLMTAANVHEVYGYFAELLAQLRPTVVHFHHYIHMGLECLKAVKDVNPEITLVLTLHEYIAICPNAGLMMKPGSDRLCKSGAYDHHLECAPEKSDEDLWIRKRRFEEYFAFVDAFVAPSEFLRDRYIEWGIDERRIVVIRNGHSPVKSLPARDIGQDNLRNRFGFFGQLAPHKGLDVVLRAMLGMSDEDRSLVHLTVNGANLSRQPSGYVDDLRALASKLMQSGNLVSAGPYASEELADRMRQVDWVVVPSIWFENAPVVIQEAYQHGRPVIVSDLGGMKEAVPDGGGGFRVARGNPAAWADMLVRLAGSPDLWDQARERIPQVQTSQDCARAHLELFKRIQAKAD